MNNAIVERFTIRLGDGFVSNYNATEQSCEWVSDRANAHLFETGFDAQIAKANLELPRAMIEPMTGEV